MCGLRALQSIGCHTASGGPVSRTGRVGRRKEYAEFLAVAPPKRLGRRVGPVSQLLRHQEYFRPICHRGGTFFPILLNLSIEYPKMYTEYRWNISKRAVKTHMQKLGRKYALVFIILLLFISLFLYIRLFEHYYSSQIGNIENAGLRLKGLIENGIEVRTYSIFSMRNMAEEKLKDLNREFLNRKGNLPFSQHSRFVSLPDNQGYALHFSDDPSSVDWGTITGTGPIPQENSPKAAEMAMAVNLTPLFKSLRERFSDTPSIYYLSLDHFLYLYPPVDSGSFFFSETLYETDSFKKALSDSNPEGNPVWTDVYVSPLGGETIVTVSIPVRMEGRTVGVIGIDINKEGIEENLSWQDIPFTEKHLVLGDLFWGNPRHGHLASIEYDTLPEGKSIRFGKKLVTRYSLSAGSWSLLLETERSRVIGDVILSLAPIILVGLFLLISFILSIKLHNALELVEELSTKDGLTSIWNRRMFDQISEMEYSRLRRKKGTMGLILFDIDHFKHFNDTYGHQEGDRILKKVSRAANEGLKRKTDYLFRVGGEEFAALTAAENEDQLIQEAEILRRTVENLNIANEANTSGILTVSLGTVLVRGEENLGFDRYYQWADMALYKSKNGGRNTVTLSDKG